jgi:hypothetical protein
MCQVENKNKLIRVGKVVVAEIDVKFKYKPNLNKNSLSIIEKMKKDGKFGKNAIEHMYQHDIQNRKEKLKKAYIVEIKTEKKERNKVNVNDKSNKMVAQKFK